MRHFSFLISLAALCCAGSVCWSNTPAEGGSVFMMPMSCSELLPDPGPFLGYFDAVARGTVARDRQFSKRLFRILQLREKLNAEADRAREQNQIDVLIRKTMCFYREQKEPLRPIPYDDESFVKFLKSSLKELELKVDDAVYDTEFERQQRREYERQLKANQGIVERVRQEAENEATRSFDRLSSAAKRKVKLP